MIYYLKDINWYWHSIYLVCRMLKKYLWVKRKLLKFHLILFLVHVQSEIYFSRWEIIHCICKENNKIFNTTTNILYFNINTYKKKIHRRIRFWAKANPTLDSIKNNNLKKTFLQIERTHREKTCSGRCVNRSGSRGVVRGRIPPAESYTRVVQCNYWNTSDPGTDLPRVNGL